MLAWVSAGAPYAYALQAAQPERVAGLYVLSGLPNIADEQIFALYDKQHQEFYNKIWQAPLEEVRQYMQTYLKKYNNPLLKLLMPQWKPAIEATMANDFRGVAQSVALQMHPWGFDVYDLPCADKQRHCTSQNQPKLQNQPEPQNQPASDKPKASTSNKTPIHL